MRGRSLRNVFPDIQLLDVPLSQAFFLATYYLFTRDINVHSISLSMSQSGHPRQNARECNKCRKLYLFLADDNVQICPIRTRFAKFFDTADAGIRTKFP